MISSSYYKSNLFRLGAGLVIFVLICTAVPLRAQVNRSQLPGWMKRMSFEVQPSYLNYPFSQAQLNPGFMPEKIEIPNLALRLGLAYQINTYLSAKLSYLMPAGWVTYTVQQMDGMPNLTRPVWMNYAGFTLNGHVPLSDRLEAFAEAGSAFVTRKGFSTNEGIQVINHATYFSWLIGAGLRYQFHPSWSAIASAGWMPASITNNQPRTVYAGLGVGFTPVQKKKPELSSGDMIHPGQWIQIGYSGNQAGYGVNHFFSTNLGVFWGGRLQVQEGLMIQYQRNIFHTRKWFALDWGVNAAMWLPEPTMMGNERVQQRFYTLSVYPVFRLNFLQTKPADVYFFYSVAGPSVISQSTINGIDLGEKFIFTDTMGIGAFAGNERKLAFELRIGHYSNGNMFPFNPGVKVPLTLLAGYCL